MYRKVQRDTILGVTKGDIRYGLFVYFVLVLCVLTVSRHGTDYSLQETSKTRRRETHLSNHLRRRSTRAEGAVD